MSTPTATNPSARPTSADRKPNHHHPAVANVLRFFGYEHLPTERERSVCEGFALLAQQVADRAPESQETTVALRKLLEARDAAVRAAL